MASVAQISGALLPLRVRCVKASYYDPDGHDQSATLPEFLGSRAKSSGQSPPTDFMKEDDLSIRIEFIRGAYTVN
jgi:hypothetical protein